MIASLAFLSMLVLAGDTRAAPLGNELALTTPVRCPLVLADVSPTDHRMPDPRPKKKRRQRARFEDDDEKLKRAEVSGCRTVFAIDQSDLRGAKHLCASMSLSAMGLRPLIYFLCTLLI
jgi:hypothetical protein